MRQNLVRCVGAVAFVVSCGGAVSPSGDPGADGGNVVTAGSGSASASTGAGGANAGASTAASGSVVTTGIAASSSGSGGASSASSGAGGSATAGRAGQGGSVLVADAGAGVCTPNAGPSVARTFTNRQYDNTIRDLLGYQGVPSKDLKWPSDPQNESGFEIERAEPISMVRLAHYLEAAQMAAADTVTNRLQAVLGCDAQAMGEDACASSFIQKFGFMAYRSPLTAVDSATLQKVYRDARANGSNASAIQSVITNVLVSPRFYLIEGPGVPDTLTPLSPYQLATRLSYFVTQSTPDRQLLDAAATGVLSTPDGVEKETRRLLSKPHAREAVKDFFRQWLELDSLDWPNPPELGETRQHMKTEVELFGEQVVFGGLGVKQLLTSRQTFANDSLAVLYGLPGFAGSTFRPVTLDMSQRSGVLTLLGPLAADSRSDGNPVYRGKLVRDRFLCQPVPPPPNVIPPLDPPSMLPPNTTNRQRYQEHVKNPICVACHSLLDPIGFGFENYDGAGRYRVTDHGQPVDASGNIASVEDASVAGPFQGAIELASKLAGSRQVHACMAQQWFRFAMSRVETEQDRCTIDAVASVLWRGEPLTEALVAIAKSDSLRWVRW